MTRFRTTRSVLREAPAMSCSKNTRNGSTTSAMRGNDERNQFDACKNCMSPLTV